MFIWFSMNHVLALREFDPRMWFFQKLIFSIKDKALPSGDFRHYHKITIPEFRKSFKRYKDIVKFSSIFINFLIFSCHKKKLMTSACKRWCQCLLTFKLPLFLNTVFKICIKLCWYWISSFEIWNER